MKKIVVIAAVLLVSGCSLGLSTPSSYTEINVPGENFNAPGLLSPYPQVNFTEVYDVKKYP